MKKVQIGCLFLVLMISLVLYFYFCVYVPYEINSGNHWKGIGHKYYQAMSNGQGTEAVFWAKKGYAYEILGKGGQIHDSEIRIGQAYELDGQFEKALHWYEVANEPLSDVAAGRIYYKLNRHEEAFEAYCHFAEKSDKSKHYIDFYRNLIMQISSFPLLCPYRDFSEFQTFIETEYGKMGKPDKYAEAMEKIRAM